MIPSSITTAERELRRVIERPQEGDVSRILAAYGEIAGSQVHSLPPRDPMRLQICERVLSVLDWARLMLQTRRSTLAEDLLVLDRTQRFLGAEPTASPRFRADL